jgi:hypothetical protein
VRSLTSYNPAGLHGLLKGELHFFRLERHLSQFRFFCVCRRNVLDTAEVPDEVAGGSWALETGVDASVCSCRDSEPTQEVNRPGDQGPERSACNLISWKVGVLAMVCSAQNSWASRPFHRPAFRKLDPFPSSGEGGRHVLCWVP